MDAATEQAFAHQRQVMVEQQIKSRGIRAPNVLNAMLKVPRHQFVPPSLQNDAYADRPLEIGNQQTISQPYIVAYMLQAAEIHKDDLVLEIGAGSGYATALLAELARMVVSLERYSELAQLAFDRLTKLSYGNFEIHVLDGTLGYPPQAPYDVIFVSAAAPHSPPALIGQLALGGRMVIPIGDVEAQQLHLITRTPQGTLVRRLEGCRFVPLVGAEGFRGTGQS